MYRPHRGHSMADLGSILIPAIKYANDKNNTLIAGSYTSSFPTKIKNTHNFEPIEEEPANEEIDI